MKPPVSPLNFVRECQLWIAILLGAASLPASGINARAGLFDERQPDGSVVRLQLRGSEHSRWLEDAEGYAVVRREDAAFVYVEQPPGRAGAVVTNRWVGKGPPPPNAILKQQPPKEGVTKMQALPERVSPAPKKGRIAGPLKNLVIPFRFSNHGNRALPSQEEVSILFNAQGGDPAIAPTGSVRDFYQEVSYGQLDLQSTVIPWVTLPQSESYYANGESGLTPRIAESIRGALEEADRTVDFRDFDRDGDGWIDAITFLHSGFGAEWGGIDQDGVSLADRIWSHRWSITTWTSAEGVKVSDYHISPSLWGTSGRQIGRIGVICHETGHFFGMPDLYDTSQVDPGEGAGSWCLMANSWGFDQSQLYPPHPSGWCKMRLGWLTPQVIDSAGTYQVLASEAKLGNESSTPQLYMVTAGFPEGEYLLIENRQPVGFDAGIPPGQGGRGGLAVWHIDELKGHNDHAGWPGQAGWPSNDRHYMVALLQADGRYDLEQSGQGRGDGDDVFRAGHVSRIDAGSIPSTMAYQSGVISRTGHAIRNISASSTTMTFEFQPGTPEATAGQGKGNPPIESPEVANQIAASSNRLVRGSHELAAAVHPAGSSEYMALLETLLSEAEASKESKPEISMEASLLHGTPLESHAAMILSDSAHTEIFVDINEAHAALNGDASGALYTNPTWKTNQAKILAKSTDDERIFLGSKVNEGEHLDCVAVGNGTSFLGTGVLLAPNLILTAAHCVTAELDERVYIGQRFDDPGSGRIYRVRHSIVHDQHNRLDLKHDIALLVLDEPVQGVKCCPIASDALLRESPQLEIVGFGRTERNWFGIKMRAQVAIASYDATDPESAIYGAFPDLEMVAGGGGVDSCNGDSGGPGYVTDRNGVKHLAGITSRKTKNTLIPCGKGGIYVRVDRYRDWILSQARQHGIHLDHVSN
jgi:M6 family metalloprotease-like protein